MIRYTKLLKQDVEWLQRAAHSDGWYTYTLKGTGGDHSNTQFANLGLWAGSVAKVEVGNRMWQVMAKHWLETQLAEGGWAYAPKMASPTSSMTIAGCNSLYIALDRFYARPDSSYRLFEGIQFSKDARQRIAQIHAAIDRGDQFLRTTPPDATLNGGYELFGLERLGLASGKAFIGGQDWFRAYADIAAEGPWGRDVIADAFSVIFLVHGQAPIIIQKLEHGACVDEWNYYQRDANALTRYLNYTFERLHRWQRLPATASLEDMQDAPILYISGHDALELPEAARATIRSYVDHGGTVFLHADRAGRKFVDSTTRYFEDLLRDLGSFETLQTSHPIYRCHFGGTTSPWKRVVPLKAISDGARLPVILCPVDIAGAWQQDRGPFEDLFKIMANIRVYCAPPYAELPRRLRSVPPPGEPAPSRGSLTLARPAWPDSFNAHAKAWAKYRGGLNRRTGIDLHICDTSADLKSWRSADVVHLSVKAGKVLDGHVVNSLHLYLETGGLVLIDAGDGHPDDIAAVRQIVDQLGVGQRAILPSAHPVVTGTMPGGHPLADLEATEAGAGLTRGKQPPPIIVRTVADRPVVLACPFDITAGLDGCYIWERIGYQPESTQRLVDNILLWRLDELAKRPSPAPSR